MKTYKVTANALHMRKGPGIEQKITTLLPKGTKLHGVGENEAQTWVEGRATVKGRTYHGWCSKKFLLEISGEVLTLNSDPPWLEIAFGELGTKEIKGEKHNPRVLAYLQSCELLSKSLQRRDETAWCSAFVNWCIEQTGLEGTNSAWARDWLNWGEKLTTPTRGCVVVFSRGPGGHVGFYLDETETHIEVLGGNQNDEVNVLFYSKRRVLGYRSMKVAAEFCECKGLKLAI